ncbi:MAG TPA: carbamoyl phosphate synthase small subunit [Bacilli bacterium]|nr:carbamoyl phosphate synthase small subunit [Bacilli bacterium]
MKGCLVLENGRVFHGDLIGATQQAYGEVVFHTGMTGYQEILTDPSYAGQIVVMTYPLIGNCGLNVRDFEAQKPWLTGFITSEACDLPSHHESEGTLADYLAKQGIVGLTGVDTRRLVQTIRQHGSLKGYIVAQDQREHLVAGMTETASEKGSLFPALPRDTVKRVTTPTIYTHTKHGDSHVVLLDFGAKANIARSLAGIGCRVTVVPATTSFDKIQALEPDGIMLSNGPGDPQDCADLLPTIRRLGETYPMFGICLGHQLIALAYGARTEKMKFGHRGSNHPVKSLATGQVWMTSQNHGYTVSEADFPAALTVTHRNVNDGTVEGIAHAELPVFSVQFHPEAAPGPQESYELFLQFLVLIRERKGQQLVYAT